MHRAFLIFLCLSIYISDAGSVNYVRDSTAGKGFHLLSSFKPLLKSLGSKDSSEHFLYSRVQFELQYHYKRHMLGIGGDAAQKTRTNYVNGLPNEVKVTKYAYSPFYSYMVYAEKRWKCYVGIAYIYNYEQTFNTLRSNIEVIAKQSRSIEEGSDLFFRVNYRLNRRFSLEMETAFYYTRARVEYEEIYALTPLLNTYKIHFQNNRTYAFPSNVFLKYSF